jgi:hypothetical protein
MPLVEISNLSKLTQDDTRAFITSIKSLRKVGSPPVILITFIDLLKTLSEKIFFISGGDTGK